MPTCLVCLDTLKNPAVLPCGHVFCYECIIRLVRSVASYTTKHFCPTCKYPYTISNIDPDLVPHHLRQHVTPSVRRLQLQYSIPSPTKEAATNAECSKLLAENVSLRNCCFVWRKRAAVHASATMGFVGLARLARDYALRVKKERDEFEAKYNELKKLYDEKLNASMSPPESSSCPSSPRSEELRSGSPFRFTYPPPPEAGLPPSIARSGHRPHSRSAVRLPSPAMSEDSFCSDCPDCLERKRKHGSEEPEDTPERPIKRSHSTSPAIPMHLECSPETSSVARYLKDSLTL